MGQAFLASDRIHAGSQVDLRSVETEYKPGGFDLGAYALQPSETDCRMGLPNGRHGHFEPGLSHKQRGKIPYRRFPLRTTGLFQSPSLWPHRLPDALQNLRKSDDDILPIVHRER